MKPLIDLKVILFSFLLISGAVVAQQQNTTPSNTDYIHCNFSVGGGSANEFSFVPLNALPVGAHNSHLWWSGDNEFSFAPTPIHTHPKSSIGVPYSAKMTDIVTENYGNGGPPPLTYTFLTRGDSKIPRTVLNPGQSIYMQNYRNAVIGDTMYLIVSYGNFASGVTSGRIKLDVGGYAEILDAMLTSPTTRHFLPNDEQWDAGLDEFTFSDVRTGEERSVLIPVRILLNDEDTLEMRVDLFNGYQEKHQNRLGLDYFAISASVAHSHDPNLMLESSDARNECDYRNGTIHYTVKFQNVGDAATKYVRVETSLDDKVDMNQISGIELPDVFNQQYATTGVVGGHDLGGGAIVYIDRVNRKIIFEMHDLALRGTGQSNVTDLELTRDQVEFDIKVKSNYVFGPATVASSLIFFDENDPIETNSVATQCGDPLPESLGGGFQKVEPTVWDKWKWYIISASTLTLGLVGLLAFGKRK